MALTTDTGTKVQDGFIEFLAHNKTPLTIYLVNGVKLLGEITGYDSVSLSLQRDNQTQLVYKHAISTILPLLPVESS